MGENRGPDSALTDGAVWLATLLLPRGEHRDRYRIDLDSEMRALPRGERYRLALGIMASAFSLRRAVVHPSPDSEGLVVERTGRPLLCRLHLHHVWRTESTSDGGLYRRCALCGLDDDGLVSGRFADHNELIIGFLGNAH